MRFVGSVLQFTVIVSAFCILGNILPSCLLDVFTWVAHVFLCFNLAFWIIEFTQDHFFTARIDPKNKAVLVTVLGSMESLDPAYTMNYAMFTSACGKENNFLRCDSGFGNAIAQILDKKGYKVFATCLDVTSDGATELRDKCSSRMKILQMDVTLNESVDEAVKTVEENLDNTELWAIVNNAGVLRGFHTELSTMKDYDMCMQVNALGMVRVTKAFLPFIRKSKGRVVNICSLAGRTKSSYLGAYVMSKAAAVYFTEILMREMIEFGVRVISIEPEFFKTPLCSEDNIKNIFNESLSNVNEEIKSAYGTNYIEEAKRIYSYFLLTGSSEVQRVFGAVESAISLQNPAPVYKPSRSIYLKTFFFLAERVPNVFHDLGFIIVLFYMGLSTPRKGINIFLRLIRM